MKAYNVFRWIGNVSLLVGHFILIYVSVPVGLVICLSSNLMVMPWSYEEKYWDVLVLLSFFSVIEGTKLLSYLI